MPTCSTCGAEISQQRYELFEGLCTSCHLAKRNSIDQAKKNNPLELAQSKVIKIPTLGIAIIILDIIAGSLIFIFQDTTYVFYATPFAIFATLGGYAAFKLDLAQDNILSLILAGIGAVIGLILFFVSIWSLLLFGLLFFTGIP